MYCIRAKRRWKILKMKKGGNLRSIFISSIRHRFTLCSWPLFLKYDKKAYHILKDFFLICSKKCQFDWKLNKTLNYLIWVQRKAIWQQNNDIYRLKVLQKMWLSLIMKLRKEVIKNKDKRTNSLIILILQIPNEIKDAVLKYYLNMC